MRIILSHTGGECRVKYIYAISPQYLEALYDEVQDFSFQLQGYGAFAAALAGLRFVSAKDVLGFVYLADKVPKKTKVVQLFLEYMNNYFSGKIFILVIKDETNLTNVMEFNKYSRIKFMHINNIEHISDTMIRHDIFGTILRENFAPYKFDSEGVIDSFGSIRKLEYSALFQKEVLDVFKPIQNLSTLERTLAYDPIYNELKKTKSYLENFRKMYIAFALNEDIEPIQCQLEKSTEALKTDKEYCTALGLLVIFREALVKRVDS